MRCDDNIVKLDIGGTVFKTSKSTLTNYEGMLRLIMETGVPVTKDESGAIFIDRDPTHFRRILNFMRDGYVELPESIEMVREIQQEAQYYLLEELVDLCNSKLPSTIDKVKLNVGGKIFQTSKTTLTKFDGFFKMIMESEIPVNRDEIGAIFIDRSPKHFDLILSFMRWNRFLINFQLPSSINELEEIKNEAQFYRLLRLRDLCVERIDKEEMNKSPLFCDGDNNPYIY